MKALVAVGVWAVVAAQATPPPPLLPTPINGDFSQAENGVPSAWTVTAGGRVSTTPEGAARLVQDAEAGNQWTRLVQWIDATRWRGKIVRLSARVRVIDPGDHVGLRLHVERPEGLSGYYDFMEEAPLLAGDWRPVAMTGVVEADATSIAIGTTVRGGAEIEIDDVLLEELPQSDRPISPEARAYLDHAIRIVRERHMDAGKHDWTAISARAYWHAAGAQTPRDTYPAIRGVLSAMGDNHGFLRPPRPAAPPAAGVTSRARAPAPPLPRYAMVDGRFGMLWLPALSMLSESERPHGQAYVDTLRAGLQELDREPLCGWIVDLRENGGGNMWPMVNGLRPLLGSPPFGAFVRPGGAITRWTLQPGAGLVTTEGQDMREMGLRMAPFRVRQAARPVAVLIGPRTASSGEAVAIALAGRAQSRSFGKRSGGYTSANTVERLSDGAVLAVPGSWEADRTGREYRSAITPDQLVQDGSEMAAAMGWLAAQCQAEAR